MRSFVALSALVATVSGSWSTNLNYRSPSELHPALGISVHKVAKRGEPLTRQYEGQKVMFTHGVASGDPYPQNVILWTRASPVKDDDKSNITVSGTAQLYDHETTQYVEEQGNPVCLDYVVASDQALTQVVDSGRVFTSSDIDYTVKVNAGGMQAFTNYYYQFTVCGTATKSPLGRTKTSPHINDDVTALSLAVYSCSNFPFGFFNAFGNPARKDSVDYVIHLGDYIYEAKNGDYGDGSNIGRVALPDRTIFTLYDYRKRLATYRTDKDLLLSHQQFAWIPVWDDHEVADNTWKSGSSELYNNETSFTEDGGVSVDQRKMNAVRAYFEWMPIRQVDMDDNLRIWRKFQLGKLVDLLMLDTRQYDRSITDTYDNTDYIRLISNDTGRSMMGPRQEIWFYNQLSASAARGTTWRVIGSQTVFSRLNESFSYGTTNPLDYDAWDGYQANRNRTLKHLYENNINNNIMLAGDSHANWVSDLVWLDGPDVDYDPLTGAGAVGAEFAGTAVSSPSPFGESISMADARRNATWLVNHNRELQWQEAFYRGYYELHLSPEACIANYFGMGTTVTRNPYEISLANFTVMAGANRLSRPVAGGLVENGALKKGMTKVTNITHNTANNTYFVGKFAAQSNTFGGD